MHNEHAYVLTYYMRKSDMQDDVHVYAMTNREVETVETAHEVENPLISKYITHSSTFFLSKMRIPRELLQNVYHGQICDTYPRR